MTNQIFSGMEYVYEVYRQGSFQKAAEAMYISQPSVSASVRRVEERLGAAIFDRSVKPLALTNCGRRYIEAAERIMAMENELLEYVADLEGLLQGELVLGGSSLFSSLVLPPLMSCFHSLYPQIRLELVEETSVNLETMLQRGSVDMVVDYDIPHPENYVSSVLEDEHLLLAVPRKRPVNEGLEAYRLTEKCIRQGEEAICGVPTVPLQLFRNEEFILLKQGNDTRRRADALCEAAGFRPASTLEFDQQLTSYHVSCSGMGLCFVSSFLVRRLGNDPDMVYYRTDGEPSYRQVCLFRRRGRYVTRAMEAFQKMAVGK